MSDEIELGVELNPELAAKLAGQGGAKALDEAGRIRLRAKGLDQEQIDRATSSGEWVKSCGQGANLVQRQMDKGRRLPRRLVLQFPDQTTNDEPAKESAP